MKNHTLSLNVNGRMREIPVRIKSRERASSFRLWIDSDGAIALSKPRSSSESDALKFLDKNSAWVREQLSAWKPKLKLSEWLAENPRLYANGREWSVWVGSSRTSPLYVADEGKSEIAFMADSEEGLYSALLKFASEKLSEDARAAAAKAGLTFKKLTVRDQGSRWASMSTSGTLSVNWRVLLLEPRLQNYIICHELAHTKFMDHSVSFWIFLNKICPGAKKLDAGVTAMSERLFSIA